MIIKLKVNSTVCHPASKISAMCIFFINHNKIFFHFEILPRNLALWVETMIKNKISNMEAQKCENLILNTEDTYPWYESWSKP